MPAKNGGQINFGIGFDVDETGLKKIRESLQKIQLQAKTIDPSSSLSKSFQISVDAVKKLQAILNKSWNNELGKLNLGTFNQSVNETFGSLEKMKQSLISSGDVGKQAYNNLTSQILTTNDQLKTSNKLLDQMATTLSNTIRWGIASSIMNTFTGAVENAWSYVKNLDTSLNDIRIVTGNSADQMERFAVQANAAAKSMGASTLDYTKTALGFYQQGKV